MSAELDADTAAAMHAAWAADEPIEDIAKRFGVDKSAVRKAIFGGELAKGGPSTTLIPVGGPAVGEAVVGDVVAEGAAYLPIQYRGEGPPPPGAPQHIIDNWLPPSARRLILRGKSPHTLKAYMQAMGWWVRFAKANGITVIPAPQNSMIRQLDWWSQFPVHVGCAGSKQKNGDPCTGHRPSPSAVWTWYSAVKWFHGLGEPPAPWQGGVKLADAIKGYINDMKAEGWRPTRAPRAYPDHLRAMIDTLDQMPDEPPPGWDEWGTSGTTDEEDPSNDDKPVWFHPARRDMLRAMILLAFYTAGRASDVARYRVYDIERFVTIDEEGRQRRGLKMILVESKANRGSRDVEYRTIHEDLDNPAYCGVKAVERWLTRMASVGINEGALIRPVHKRGGISRGKSDQASYTADVSGLSRAVRMVAKAAWQRSGKTILQEWRQFTIHSLRRGRVQLLLEEGADVFDVETELGWAHGGAMKFYRAEVKLTAATAANAKGML